MIAMALVFGVLLFAAIVFLLVMRLASDSGEKEFDGGFDHENLTRITRVRGTYIINDDNGEKR